MGFLFEQTLAQSAGPDHRCREVSMPILKSNEIQLFDLLKEYTSEIEQEFATISDSRKVELDQLREYIKETLESEGAASVIFVCTHNSRRSHMAQIWAEVAARHYGIEKVQTFSGGTEETAFNIRTVNALRRAGFSIIDSTGGGNPHFLVQYSDSISPAEAFSKKYSAATNPQENFAAVLCCGDAEKKCPQVNGAEARISLHYNDPKSSDGSDAESRTYDERCRQIAVEMFYVMSEIVADDN